MELITLPDSYAFKKRKKKEPKVGSLHRLFSL